MAYMYGMYQSEDTQKQIGVIEYTNPEPIVDSIVRPESNTTFGVGMSRSGNLGELVNEGVLHGISLKEDYFSPSTASTMYPPEGLKYVPAGDPVAIIKYGRIWVFIVSGTITAGETVGINDAGEFGRVNDIFKECKNVVADTSTGAAGDMCRIFIMRGIS